MTRRARRRVPAGRLVTAAAAALCFATVAGCAPALRELPPLRDLAGASPPASPHEVDDLLARAEELFAARRPETVGRAAQLWLSAAAADPRRVEGLIGTARADVWRTDHLDDPAARAAAATRAVQAAQWCRRIAPADPSCDYWLGAALGVQARERATTGLSAVPLIEAAFLRAAAAAPTLDEAGPDRALALLYLRAPGWPGGPGDPDTGLLHARRAVALRPDHPPNLMALGEALEATGDPRGARAAYGRALELARTRAAGGDPDAGEWVREAAAALPPDPGN